MTQPPTQDITVRVLVQIRDEMHEMRASFEGRFDALEARLESLDSRVEALAARLDSIERRRISSKCLAQPIDKGADWKIGRDRQISSYQLQKVFLRER
jgi:hypothetical protein